MPKSTKINPFLLPLDDILPKQYDEMLLNAPFCPKRYWQDAYALQQKAVDALNLALSIKADAQHVFATGEAGVGMAQTIKNILTAHARTLPSAKDLVYVHNFDNPKAPVAIFLPTGMANDFVKQMQHTWHKAKKSLCFALSSPSYERQIMQIKAPLLQLEQQLQELSDKKTQDLTQMDTLQQKISIEEAQNHQKINDLHKNIATQTLMPIFAPLKRSFTKDECAKHNFDKCTDDAMHNCLLHNSKVGSGDAHINNTNINSTDANDAANNHMHHDNTSDHNANTHANGTYLHKNSLLSDVDAAKFYAFIDGVLAYMIRFCTHIADGDDEFGANCPPACVLPNIMTTHDSTDNLGAPVVFAPMPTHAHLLGHIEAPNHGGQYDVSMIWSGLLHKANGGFLVIDAQKLMEHPYAWTALLHAIKHKQISLQSLEQLLTLTGSTGLLPESVPLKVQVVLMGDENLYYELLEYEPDFAHIFSIRADFRNFCTTDDASVYHIAQKLDYFSQKYTLRKFDTSAKQAFLQALSHYVDDRHLMDMHHLRSRQLAFEADAFARLDASNTILSTHVIKAYQNMFDRQNALQQLYWRELENGQQCISTEGWHIGQVNALSVIGAGFDEFGLPARITAALQPKFGAGDVIDIERTVELGGSLHAKGMLIMTSFLRALFSEKHALNFSASIVFEQNYGHIDGDSATAAECCALLSALSGVPLHQHLAVTGSMNQLGQIQAVGGINAKIYAFFKLCQMRQFAAHKNSVHGVIIPYTNVDNLVLHGDVIDAIKQGKFAIYAVFHIFEALNILTDQSINDTTKNGDYKKSSLLGKIGKRLDLWASKDASKPHKKPDNQSNDDKAH